jgi:uncharacterized lipoprotein YmbA
MQKIQAFMLTAALALGGCASAATKPAVIEQPPVAITTPVHVSDVSIDAVSGVWVNDADLAALHKKILGTLAGQEPASGPAAGTPVYTMRVMLTRFEAGSAAARMAFIGLGQIHIEGTVTLLDADGKQRGQYKITKAVVVGGLIGGFTSVGDVEDGFAKSAAEIVAPKH